MQFQIEYSPMLQPYVILKHKIPPKISNIFYFFNKFAVNKKFHLPTVTGLHYKQCLLCIIRNKYLQCISSRTFLRLHYI